MITIPTIIHLAVAVLVRLINLSFGAEINTFPIMWFLFNSQFSGFISASSLLFIISLLSCSVVPPEGLLSFSETDFDNKKAVNGTKTGCERSWSGFQARRRGLTLPN